ncbi:MAG: methyltransferase domain-containing protein [Chloroflexi bacterium]|nr:methyltransferase domain-containing protein [Chloroflexota bacterium]
MNSAANTARRTRAETFGRLLAAAEALGGPPPDFLRYRRNQLDLILAQADIPWSGTVLELGGGVSGQGLLLADLAPRVVCTDLLEVTSVYGGDFTQAARLASFAPSGRLQFICGRGEDLPLQSNSVDVVFSSYVFEHIGDRPAAAAEIWRVLRPGGVAIANVPNIMEPAFRALHFSLRVAPIQVAKAALARSGLDRRAGLRFRVPPPRRPRSVRELRQWLRGTLTYPPHGDYGNHLEELLASTPGH